MGNSTSSFLRLHPKLRQPARLMAVALLAVACLGGAKHREDPKIFVRFHIQTNELDASFSTPVTLVDPPRRVFVEKVPSISEKDISSFAPYRAADGSYSVAFQLDRHGQLTLQNLSLQKRGQMLMATVNGRLITPLTIDKPINDGVIYVPFGLTEAEIKALGEAFPITSVESLRNKPARDPDMNPLAPQASTPRP
jgi:hypothetical protein